MNRPTPEKTESGDTEFGEIKYGEIKYGEIKYGGIEIRDPIWLGSSRQDEKEIFQNTESPRYLQFCYLRL